MASAYFFFRKGGYEKDDHYLKISIIQNLNNSQSYFYNTTFIELFFNIYFKLNFLKLLYIIITS